jgi:hypothetical protein
MRVYLAIIEDRHTDVAVCVFSTAEKAIAYAREWAYDNARSPDRVEEQEIDGWLYSATYSVEGDAVRVEEAEVIEGTNLTRPVAR